jgi:hypothetical protein
MTEESMDEDKLDPGPHIGPEPEREAETIPGGVGPRDEPTPATDSRPGVPGEPEDDGAEEADATKTDMGAEGPDGQVYGG